MSERVALVTGGSRGIGRSVCQHLATDHVVAVNYNVGIEEAKETLAGVEEAGGGGFLVQADVFDKGAVDAMFETVEDAIGPVSVLVNNAGIRRDRLTARMTDDDWGHVLAIDLTGAFFCTRRGMRPMLSNGYGRVVNVSSVAGVRGVPGQANYCAAKAGLIGFTRSMARELGRKNVTVNAVAPGLVETELTASLDDKRYAEIIREIPVGRAAAPDEIATVVAFLCSEKAAYVNGAVVVADGGMTA